MDPEDPDLTDEATPQRARPGVTDWLRDRAGTLLAIVLGAILATSVAYIGVSSAARGDANGRVASQALAAAQEANRRLEKAGEPTVAIPSEKPVVNGQDGQDAPPPSHEQVLLAVAAFCRDTGECRGPAGFNGTPGTDGKNGKDGQNVTPAQAAAAIATYCDANGQCRGERGAQGPAPTDTQIAAGVAAFCADGACRGPEGAQGEKGDTGEKGERGETGERGEKGDTGDRGPAGRGIASTKCTDGRWQVTYTDDTTEDAGACTPAPGPTQTITEPGPTTTITVTPTEEPTQEES